MSPVVIFGASRQGCIALEILRAQGVLVEGFVDDDPALEGKKVLDLPVLGNIGWAIEHCGGHTAIVAIGHNRHRVRIAHALRRAGMQLINVVHPSATLLPSALMGTGNLVAPGATLMTGVHLHDDVVVNTGTSIDHDSVLESGAYLSPGVCTAGQVTVGAQTFVGTGAILGPGVSVGPNSVVGAGSLVLRNVPASVLAVGSPARIVRELDEDAYLKLLRAAGGVRA